MSKILTEVLSANQAYASTFGEKSKLALPPARGFAILTCMDARLDPAKHAGLSEGDAHVIRNAGGRASDDAIRSLVISYKLLGTKEFFVIHHTDCGSTLLADDELRHGFAERVGTDERTLADTPVLDPARTVTTDVNRVLWAEDIPQNVHVSGHVYDVATGLVTTIVDAKARK